MKTVAQLLSGFQFPTVRRQLPAIIYDPCSDLNRHVTLTVQSLLTRKKKKNRNLFPSIMKLGFTDSSVGKGSACNAEDSSSISGLGRSAGEGIGYPPQYSWASLVA